MGIIVSSTPLRISLVGGSTDLEDFITATGKGKVVSFTPNLYTYIFLNPRKDNKIVVQYSKIEVVEDISEIKNDIARVVLQYFNCTDPINIIFTTDIPAVGSGLASSTSYLISMIRAVAQYKNITLSPARIINLAIELERKFNSLTGRQDAFGCFIPGLKYIEFFANLAATQYKWLDSEYFDNKYMYLLPSHARHDETSTDINRRWIENTNSIEKRRQFVRDVDDFLYVYLNGNYEAIPMIIQWSYSFKEKFMNRKFTHELIDRYKNIVLAYKLCGAGNGGYFWILASSPIEDRSFIPIKICQEIPIVREI